MRIVIEPGSYTCMNMGDVAMMQVCVKRLEEIWPGAQIQVVTQSLERLAFFCPNAEPIIETGKNYWFEDKLFGRLGSLLPSSIRPALRASETALHRHFPFLVGSLLATKRRIRHLDSSGLAGFVNKVMRADLVVASGMGMINDEFRDRALQMLATVQMAQEHGIPTALMCQGIGPITDPELLACLQAVLPNVKLITLRERLLGPEILKAIGYPIERVALAGDDGLQLASQHRSHALGDAIGVNLRVAKYSQIEGSMVCAIRNALEKIASNLSTSFVPVPILFRDDSDMKAIAPLIAGLKDQSSRAPVMTTLDVIQRIGRCRLVLTGSYHGAVFALGQGIPAVTVAKSPYYLSKFKGLEEQFGDGCQLIDWSEKVSVEQLNRAVDRTWNSAAKLRPMLLEASEEQIRSSDDAYLKLQSVP